VKVIIIGQCQGGNAKLWQDFLENYKGFKLVHYVCRNRCQSDFNIKSNRKRVFRFYNLFVHFPLIQKVWVRLVSLIVLPLFIRLMDKMFKYDIIHFQGNYEPEFNFRLMNATKAKAVITIYGSDFYQRYLKGDDSYIRSFERTINRANHILFNFEKARQDFLQKINIPVKCSVGCIGVNDFWSTPVVEKFAKDSGVTRLLSARCMYAYNNVEVLVDSFIDLYANNSAYELYLINGYGWDGPVKESIIKKVKTVSNIHAVVGKWITDDELKKYYDLCDYNFCIGSTDQLSVSIVYGFMHKSMNILSPLDNYKELDVLQFRSHYFLEEVSHKSIKGLLRSLPKRDSSLLEDDRIKAIEIFSFANRFENTKRVFDSLLKLND